MLHRVLKVDCSLHQAPAPGTAPPAGVCALFHKTAERSHRSERRCYYAGAGAGRLLVVTFGLPLPILAEEDAYILALVGDDAGTPGLVLPEHVGQRHLLIIAGAVINLTPVQADIYTASHALAIDSLAELLATAPQDAVPSEPRL